ncbi:hypothetical protein F5Y03DRAFT_345553 [Xylaria venustula]|nr:hypothetical protein F5Y03DRAFT_345553 [Xylaria venustula]
MDQSFHLVPRAFSLGCLLVGCPLCFLLEYIIILLATNLTCLATCQQRIEQIVTPGYRVKIQNKNHGIIGVITPVRISVCRIGCMRTCGHHAILTTGRAV